MNKEILFDADPENKDSEAGFEGGDGVGTTGGCGTGGPCPMFLEDMETGAVEFKDKQNNRARMTADDFNGFVRGARSGEIPRLDTPLRGDEHYDIGGIRFTADAGTNRIVLTGAGGGRTTMAIKHFNAFVDAAKDERMLELGQQMRR